MVIPTVNEPKAQHVVELLHFMPYTVGTETHDFAVHRNHEVATKLVLSHYQSGLRLGNVPDDTTDFEAAARELLDDVVAQRGIARFNSAVRSAADQVLNPDLPTHHQPQETSMSLEQAIQANTAALQEHTAAVSKLLAAMMSGAAISTAQNSASAETTKSTGKAKATEKAAATSATADTTTAPTDSKTIEIIAEKPVAVTIEEVRAAILKLSADKGRDAAVAVLQRAGVTKVPDLKPEQFAAVVKDANDVLAGVAAAEEALV